MNRRMYKEVRILLPAWGLTMAALLLPFGFFPRDTAQTLAVSALATGLAAMAGLSFGSEFQARTMSLLLVQPVSRYRIWFEKTLVLALGTVLAFALFHGLLRPYWQ